MMLVSKIGCGVYDGFGRMEMEHRGMSGLDGHLNVFLSDFILVDPSNVRN